MHNPVADEILESYCTDSRVHALINNPTRASTRVSASPPPSDRHPIRFRLTSPETIHEPPSYRRDPGVLLHRQPRACPDQQPRHRGHRRGLSLDQGSGASSSPIQQQPKQGSCRVDKRSAVHRRRRWIALRSSTPRDVQVFSEQSPNAGWPQHLRTLKQRKDGGASKAEPGMGDW